MISKRRLYIIAAAKQSVSEASTLISQHTMEKNHMAEKLKTLQKETSTSTLQYKKQQANINSIEKEVENLKVRILLLLLFDMNTCFNFFVFILE